MFLTMIRALADTPGQVIQYKNWWLYALMGALVLAVLIALINLRHKASKKLNVALAQIARPGASIADINAAIAFTGFAYAPGQGIFYSRKDAWQRRYGYCRLFDEAAAPFSMIIDCEPIYFEYEGRRWLIELWKGQYGMNTGAEIGVYHTRRTYLPVNGFDSALYDCVSDNEMLSMRYELYKNGKRLIVRNGVHWWLTGFVLGEFSEPSELFMQAYIAFPTQEMRDAFVEGLVRAGYQDGEYTVNRLVVGVRFGTPHTVQPASRTDVIERPAQRRNRALCEEYRTLTQTALTMSEKLRVLVCENEVLLSKAISFGLPERIYRSSTRTGGGGSA